jgi:hypothetical protein
MKCKLCNQEIVGNKGYYYWQNKKLLSYCHSCSLKVEKIPTNPEIMIVPITIQSFEKVKKEKIYAHPASYGRKGGQNIAFYISAPTSAITHISEVESILREGNNKIYILKKVIELKRPIVRGGSSGIQGTTNTTLSKLKLAKVIKDLK